MYMRLCIFLLLVQAVSSLKLSHRLLRAAASLSLGLSLTGSAPTVLAVSGGGKEFALKDIRGLDFSKQSYTGLDFTQCDAAATNFKKSILKGTRFFRANLKEADFSDADLTGATLEDTLLQGARFDNSVLVGAYFSQSIEDAGSIAGADFTDAQMPVRTTRVLCARDDAGGRNTATGVITADSLMCP